MDIQRLVHETLLIGPRNMIPPERPLKFYLSDRDTDEMDDVDCRILEGDFLAPMEMKIIACVTHDGVPHVGLVFCLHPETKDDATEREPARAIDES